MRFHLNGQEVSKMSDDGREKVLEILGPGDFVGEMALLDQALRSASVESVTDRSSGVRWVSTVADRHQRRP